VNELKSCQGGCHDKTKRTVVTDLIAANLVLRERIGLLRLDDTRDLKDAKALAEALA
jgi:hypothetical protein